MPRANRYLLDGQLYHVTHRCHDREFLLKFATDRNDYRRLARDMSHRHCVKLLTYCLTSNHVHLLLDAPDKAAIGQFMKDLAGTIAQHYNRRKRRTGGYWEGRYHATMVDSGSYLWACLLYIDLNMVRAGVVGHPQDWPWTGWQEIMGLRKRYCLVCLEALLAWTGHATIEELRTHYRHEIDDRIQRGALDREAQWTEAVAVGADAFIDSVRQQLPDRRQWEIRAIDIGPTAGRILKESTPPYMVFSAPKTTPKGDYDPSD